MSIPTQNVFQEVSTLRCCASHHPTVKITTEPIGHSKLTNLNFGAVGRQLSRESGDGISRSVEKLNFLRNDGAKEEKSQTSRQRVAGEAE